MNNFFYFVLGGILLVGILGVFALPIESSIPPTPAFKIINSTSGNVTANNYRDTVEFVEGSGIVIDADYALNKITFSSTGAGNPLEIYCSGTDKFNSYNATTHTFACSADIAASGNSTSLDDLGDVTITSPSYPSVLFYNSTQWIEKVFSINNQSVTSGFVMTGMNNLTGEISTGTIKNPLLDGSNHTDTEADAVTRGDMIVGTSASLWGELPIGASGTVLKSDGTDPSWGTLSGGVTLISGNVTFGNTAAWGTAFQIPLTANSGNNISGVLVVASNTAGGAVQAGANMSSSNGAGWCMFETPTAATADTIDFFVLGTAVTDTGETTWAPAANVAQPILFTCSITTSSPAPQLWIDFTPEVAGVASVKTGSYYIKTP